MADRYRYFAILAAMRTGSNLLEQIIAGLPGAYCFGEAFNAHFIGGPKRMQELGWSLPDRNRNPRGFLEAMIDHSGDRLAGFRFFDGHDRAIFKRVLRDPNCARIVLRRDPLQSFVSLKIAQTTGQWMLKNPNRRQTARIRFDADEFARYRRDQIDHYEQIAAGLRRSGLDALHLDYDDLTDPDLPARLADYLGLSASTINEPALVRQNPGGLRAKVINYNQMCNELGLKPEPLRHEPIPGPSAFLLPDEVPIALAPLPGPGYLPALAVLDRLNRRLTGEKPLGRGRFFDGAFAPGFFRNGTKEGRSAVAMIAAPEQRLLWLWHLELMGENDTGALTRMLERHPGLPTIDDWASWPSVRRKEVFGDFLNLVEAALTGTGDLPCAAAWRSQSELIAALQVNGTAIDVFPHNDLPAFATAICKQTRTDPIPHGQLRALASLDLPGFANDDTLTPELIERARQIHRADIEMVASVFG